MSHRRSLSSPSSTSQRREVEQLLLGARAASPATIEDELARLIEEEEAHAPGRVEGRDGTAPRC